MKRCPDKPDHLAAVVSLAIFRIVAVVDEDAAQRLGQLRERTEVRVVSCTLAGDDSEQGMVKIVAPLSIETVPARLFCFYDPGIVQIAFGDQDEMLSHRCFQPSYFTCELLQKMNRRAVIECVHRVQAQSVHVVVAQPHQRIVDQEAANFGRAGFFEIDRVAPGRGVADR